MWSMFCHLGALIPCVPCVVTLIIWQLKKNEYPLVDVHGKRALNFQITWLLVVIAYMVVSFVVSHILAFLALILMPILWLAGLGVLVLVIMAGIKTNNGEDYKYPFSLEILK
jgi:hypothetical protein